MSLLSLSGKRIPLNSKLSSQGPVYTIVGQTGEDWCDGVNCQHGTTRITWRENLKEGLPGAGWPVGKPLTDCPEHVSLKVHSTFPWFGDLDRVRAEKGI